ncbi:peptidase M20 [Dyadobacter luteus]|uniref:Peptidase M20 n=1 Tax=Dyadobacter luteus TaxID=2259619 RepID=A0A3D8YHA8_9BACT|nr:M20/M25/M40 family metallo-hydrolase [Dyadobacter luteus]REA64229.1 peptidase M20 [Dyadobacter luteus]
MKKTILAVCLCIASTAVFAQKPKSQRVGLKKEFVEEITALGSKPQVKAALQTILDLEPETRKDHILLTEIPAPPFAEEVRGKQYGKMLSEIGVDSLWTDAVGNVIALRKGKSGKKKVVIDAHLDTVFPEGTDVKVRYAGDTLKAPGIGDDTRGLAIVLTVLKALNKNKIQTEADVYVIGTVGEEGLGDLRGVKQLYSKDGLKIDSHIAVDGGGVGRIVNGGVGSLRYKVTFKGPGGHSYGAFGLVNPHNALARAIHYFTVEADKFTKTGEKTTYNIGVIGGGTSVNAIPFESWMEVDMRSESPEKLKQINQLLQTAIKRGLAEENAIKRMGEDLTVDVKNVGDRPTGFLAETAPLVQRAAAVADFFGSVPMLGMSSTNANTPLSLGIPCVTIGGGGTGGNAHALDEWWYNDKGHLAIQNALLLLLAEAGFAK